MLSVNKTFSDDKFFERVMRRKYPLLMEFKKTTWKELYVRMTYYISLLKEKFDIPYIPTKGYNPETFYNKYKNSKYIYDYAMFDAAIGGHKNLVEFFIKKGANDWNWGMRGAAEGGHKDLVEFFIDKGANNWNIGMYGAAEGGHKDLVEFFIEKGAKDWNWGMYGAAKGGHKDLVEFFIEKGAKDWNWGMYGAAEGGHKDLVDFFKKKMND